MTSIAEDAELGQAIYDAIYEWKDEDFTVDKHLTRRVAQVLMDQGYKKRPAPPSPRLAEANAETERSLVLLALKIEQAARDAAEIRASKDKSRYYLADLFDGWTRRASSLLDEIRAKQ